MGCSWAEVWHRIRLMGAKLPELEFRDFADRLRVCSPVSLSSSQVEALFLHYFELCRWNPTISLVGPIAADEVVERHYGESLAALPFLGDRSGALLDLGSGAGFPGLVIGVVRPDLSVTLVEARARKWSFLKSVCHALSLSCNCLNARVATKPVEGLPAEIDWITARAVRLDDLGLEVLLPRLVPGGTLLLWSGDTTPNLPDGLRVRRETHLAGSNRRRILEIVKEAAGPLSQ